MPFWARARRALRQAIPCIGPSRSSSPIPTPNPADTQPNESQGQEPSGHHASLQQQQQAAGHGGAHPVEGSQDTSGGSPNVAPQQSPSPDPTSSLPQAQPSTLKSSGVPQAVASQNDILNNISEEDPSQDPASSLPQQQQPTSEDNSLLPIGAPLDDIPDRTPQDGPSPSAAQQQKPLAEHNSPLPIGESQHDALDGTTQETPSPDPNPSPPQQQSTTSGRSPGPIKEHSIAKDKSTSTWYTAFKGIVTLVGKVSEAFPPLKYAATGIQALMEVYDDFSSNKEEFEELGRKVEYLNVILGKGETLPSGGKERWDSLGRAIESIGKQLERKTKQSNLVQVMTASEDKQEILRFIREIRFAIEITVLDTVARVEDDVAKLNKSDQLEKLGAVKGYGLSPDAPQCAQDTRIALIAGLLAWATDPSSVHAFWLSGMAGTGKTAVSRTLCHRLIEHDVLGASFFCSIKDHDLSDVRNIFPSLAKTLAARHPKFGDALVSILEAGKPLVDEMTLSQQYDSLILRPAETAFCDFDKNVILCTDALDECNGPEAIQEFLHAILSKKPGVRLKFFFTSRPEAAIARAVESSSYSLHWDSLRLHDIEKDLVGSDIEIYVNRELSKIPELSEEYGECWPPPEVDQIVKRADGLFIVAATIIRRINGDGKSGNPVRRLQSFGAASASTGVDELYLDIMQKATSALEDPEKEDLRSCLSLLIAAQRPLSVTEYAALLGQKVSAIAASFRSLHSVVEMPTSKDDHRPISIYHASFVDFLTSYPTSNPEASTEEARPLWAVDRREAHAMVLEWCLALMESKHREKGLYLGVSGAQTSYRGNKDQQVPRLRSDLAYACTTWGNHVLDAKPISDNLQERIKIFLECKSLYWLEALSAEGSIGSSSILWHISQIVCLDGLAKLLVDIRDFAQMFATPITFSAPHVYLSAVPFQRTMATGPQSWLLSLPSTPIVHIRSEDHRILVKTVGTVHCVGVSPDRSKVVAGCGSTLFVFNMQSGEQMGSPIEGHSGDVNSVTFSPDGARIVSVSDDKTIRIWDAQSGKQVGSPMEGHSDWVRSVAFSPDGARIVSGSDDHTVRIWDAQSGKQVGRPMEGHSRIITSVGFSPDGARIVSGSYDKTVRIWDAQSGKQVESPMEGHLHSVTSVAFSPDDARIVSGSRDKTIRVWSALQDAPSDIFFLHNYPHGIFAMDKDGWIRNSARDLLLWVPPPFRDHIQLPGMQLIIPQGHKVQLSQALSHGIHWKECVHHFNIDPANY